MTRHLAGESNSCTIASSEDITSIETVSEQDRGERFSSLLISSRHRVYGFIYSLTQNHQASEDILQEVSTILWRKFDQYEEGTDFAVWAMSVGRFCVLNWRRKQARLPLNLEDADLMRLADEAISVSNFGQL